MPDQRDLSRGWTPGRSGRLYRTQRRTLTPLARSYRTQGRPARRRRMERQAGETGTPGAL